jgi:hypothetical protein
MDMRRYLVMESAATPVNAMMTNIENGPYGNNQQDRWKNEN